MAIEQFNLFDFSDSKYKITKPIRLIEFFAGIGSQAKSLEILGVPFENWKTCEWSKESIKAYKQIHHYNEHIEIDLTKEELIEKVKGISSNYNEPMNDKQLERLSLEELKFIHECNLINHNLINISNVKGSDLEITETDKYEYVLTYSFPCQDLSLAGKQAGMSEDSGTRSSLLWQVGRILAECKNKPQILIMENVDMVLSKKFFDKFKKWCSELEEMGYTNYYQVLNAKDYGIPQNRKRCFMVSIFNSYDTYSFPLKMKLNYRLKDFLESNVDEHYYLSERMINYISKNGTENYHNADCKINCAIARPLTTEQNKRAGTTNYIADNMPEDYDIKVPEATKKGYALAREGDGIYINRPQQKRGCVQKGMIQTIKTNCDDIGVVVKKENLKQELCNKLIQSGKVQEFDVIRHSYSSKRLEEWENRGVEKHNECPTLDTRCDCLGVAVKEETLFTEPQASMITENGDVKRYINSDKVDEFKEGQVADISFPNGYNKAKRTHDNCPAINTTTTESSFITKEQQTPLRIRKLTPCECYKLMGFTKTDYEHCSEMQSNSRIYHQAGDSIVSTVLIGIFGTMFDLDYQSIIENYVKELIND